MIAMLPSWWYKSRLQVHCPNSGNSIFLLGPRPYCCGIVTKKDKFCLLDLKTETTKLILKSEYANAFPSMEDLLVEKK